MSRELLIGAGSSRVKQLAPAENKEWTNLTTLDINADHNPDVVHDLMDFPYPFDDNTFDEVHAYQVLEHLSQQGDYRGFFREFEEFWRILKPGGFFCATVPWWQDKWAWADPGHTRVIQPETLAFLSQRNYEQVGDTSMNDYRWCYSADFEPVYGEKIETEGDPGAAHFYFALKAIKKVEESKFELRSL